MPYTVTKLLIWMILAFLLGILVGWALRTLRARRDVAAARSGATGAIERPASDDAPSSSRVTVVEPAADETVSEPIEPSSPAIETAAVVGSAPGGGGIDDEIVHQREQMAEYEAELEEISAELEVPDPGAIPDDPKGSGDDPPE